MSAPIQSTYLAPGQYALGPLPLMSGEPAVCGTQRKETLGSGRCFGGRSLPLRPVFSGGIRFFFSRWLIVFSRPPLMMITDRFQALRNCAVLWDFPRPEPSSSNAE